MFEVQTHFSFQSINTSMVKLYLLSVHSNSWILPYLQKVIYGIC